MRPVSQNRTILHRLARCAVARALVEALEPRQLLSVTFANADINATWTYTATQLAGQITFDNTGLITGGSLLNTDGVTNTPSGTYAINSDGTLSIVDRHAALSGAMDAGKDLIAVGSPSSHALSVLITGTGVTFSNADLNGSWNLAVNGEAGDTNGIGTLTLDGAGNITGGSIPDGLETFAITGGTYVLNTASGTFTASVIDQNHDLQISTLTLTGAINGAKDVIALSPTDFNASSNAGTNLIIGVNSSGSAYSAADMQGTWVLANNAGNGWLNFDGAGSITAGTLVTNTGAGAVTGTYSIDAQGLVTTNVTFTTASTVQAFTFHGAMNHDKQVVAMNTTDLNSGNNLTMLVASADHVNHAPNLTTISTFQTATSGKPFAITFADLLAASNASDADSDTLHFQVTALTTGQLTLNGDAVTSASLPLTVSAGDTLAWTAPIGMSGNAVDAFSVAAFDGTLSSAAVAVAIQTVLPSVFTNTDVAATWNFAGTGAEGTLVLDGGGNVSGALTGADGMPVIPADSYDLTSEGQFTGGPSGTESGAVSATQDTIVTSDPTQAHDLNVLVSGKGLLFTTDNIAGTWIFGTSGDRPGSNSLGSIIFDTTGLVTGGTVRTGSGTKAIVSGTYAISSDGFVNLAIQVPSGQPGTTNTLSFNGQMNASMDVLALSPPDLSAAVNSSDSRLMVMVHASAANSNAVVKGTWTIAADGASGNITLDGNGHVSGGSLNNGGTASAITGSYGFSGNTLTMNLTSGGKTRTFTGAVNGSHNTIVLNRLGSASTDNLIVLVNSGNHAPTLTSVAPFATAIAAQPFTISYADLMGAGNQSDLDDNTLGFQVTSLINGGLSLNGAPVSAGALPVTVSMGDVLTWTPTLTSNGRINAFAVKAFDGTTTSATAIPVVVKTVLQPTVTVVATRPNASEINGTGSGMGMFKLMRTNGILANPLNVTLTVTGTALSGVSYTALSTEVHFDAGASTLMIPVTPIEDALAEGTQTVTLSVTSSDTGAIYLTGSPASATVKIADAASTVSVSATKGNASEVNGTSSGAGLLTVVRSGGDLSLAQTVNFMLAGTAVAGTNYNVPTSAGLTFNVTASTGTITFAPGKTTATIPINPVNDAIANSPALNVVCTITADAGPSYFISNTRPSATVKIADAAPTVSIVASKANATELNGQTTGFGQFKLTRTGLLTLPLTVNYTIGGTATNGVDYGASGTAPLTTSVTFLAGSANATITINPIDDGDMETAETVLLTLVADGGPHYFVGAKSAATVSIAPHTPTPALLTGAVHNTPFTITYASLLTATGLTSTHGPILFKITSVRSGTLKKNNVAVVANSTTLAAGESLAWTPPTNVTGTRQAFAITANDSVVTTGQMVVSVLLT